MQLCKPQRLHHCMREAGAHQFEKRTFPWRLPGVSNVVPERGKRQFLGWKHSVWETLSQTSVKRTRVHYVSLQTQRGGPLSSLLLFFFFSESRDSRT